MELVFVVRLFGHCRQAFYQSKADIEKEVAHERKVIEAVREIREEDPGIGGYKLWLMLIAMFGRDFVPGRDRFFVLMRRKGLMLPKPKPRHTTNSNHRYHKYKNLIKGFVPTAANQLWAADITYIALAGGDVCYLHLITDAYSHKIVGWALAVQYCCDAYVAVLKAHEINISMCEDYNPTDNAIAESVNGKIKVESVYRQKCFNSFEHAYRVIERYIHFYNYRRPHMSIGYKTPAVVHLEQGEQKKMWKNKIYPKKQTENENNVVSLPSRTTSLGEGVCQRT